MASDYVKNEIRANYTTEDLDSLSRRLGLKKDTVRKIANALNCRVEDIMEYIEVSHGKKQNQ